MMHGRRIRLSRARRLVIDFLHFSTGIPTIPVQRRMSLQPVIEARRGLSERPSWTAMFVKAFGIVSAEMPELRRAFVKLPWRHLFEYATPVASITVERDFEGEKAVMMARVEDPASLDLLELTRRLRSFTQDPVESIKYFRRALRMCRFPRLVRRMLWWYGFNSGPWRIRHLGTFAVSVYSALGAESLHPLSPLTSSLNYGVFTPDGQVDVRVVYDHRVLDGALVARALDRLERVLTGEILAEVRALARDEAGFAGQPGGYSLTSPTGNGTKPPRVSEVHVTAPRPGP